MILQLILKTKPGITVWSEPMAHLHVHFHSHTTMKPIMSVQVLEEMIAGATLLKLMDLAGDIVKKHVVRVYMISQT